MGKHTPGPWRWEYDATHKAVQLLGGRPYFDKTVMDFVRWGMGGAQPRFMGLEDGFAILHRLSDRRDWIRPFAGREHHAHWCSAVDHPDARLIAAAPDLLALLIRYRNEVPLGHQPHMAASEADALIRKATGESHG